MFLEYKDTVVDLKQLYYVDCGFFKEKICFVLWEDLMAFMSKTVGFDYTIRTTSIDTIPRDTAIYLPQKPEFDNGFSSYRFVKLEEVIVPENCDSVFSRFEN
jgi:hypothetical protein